MNKKITYYESAKELVFLIKYKNEDESEFLKCVKEKLEMLYSDLYNENKFMFKFINKEEHIKFDGIDLVVLSDLYKIDVDMEEINANNEIILCYYDETVNYNVFIDWYNVKGKAFEDEILILEKSSDSQIEWY